MPIEIKELHIKVQVQDESQTNNPAPAAAAPNQVNTIVAECVEQVLKIINEKKER